MDPLRRITSSGLAPRTRILVAAAVWLLLIIFLWIGLTHSVPPWLQILGWLFLVASNVVLCIGYIRWWNARRRRGDIPADPRA
jgi:energy-coupling factor transporter transmembrane protein EcfT